MRANSQCSPAAAHPLLALAGLIPAMLLLIGVPGGAAQAAIDMAAKVDMELVARAATGAGSAEDFLVRDGGVLRTGDGLQLRLASEVKAYVYIIAYGSSRTAMVLHPFSARPDDALMRPGQQAVIPKPGVFLPLDGTEGRETLFTIGAHDPVKNIADLLARIEKHGDDLEAITAMLRGDFPLVRRLSFKHIGAHPLVGVASTAPRASEDGRAPVPGSSPQTTPGDSSGVSGASLLPPAGGGWAVSSKKGFASSPETASGAASPASASASHQGASEPAPEEPAKAVGNARADTKADTKVNTDASAADSASMSSARQKAKQAAGIDENQFRGILATLPSSTATDVPESLQKPFKEDGVLTAEGSRIRALERAQAQSGAPWPDNNASSRKEFQN